MLSGFNIVHGGLLGGDSFDPEEKGAVRCVDVAEHLKVTKPSVSRAVKELEKMGHVSRDEDGG